MDRLKLLIETYYDYQKGRIAYNNRLNILSGDIRKAIEQETVFKTLGTTMKKLESTIKSAVAKELKKDKLYTMIISRIKGIGPIMGGCLIAWLCRKRDFIMAKSHPFLNNIKSLDYAKIESIDKHNVRVQMPSVLDIATYVSDLYKYCGMIPGSRRVKGTKISYNPKLKVLCWKIMRQILMAKRSYYCKLYEFAKHDFCKKYKNDEGSPKLKAHYTAMKKTIRHLLCTIYLGYKYLHKQPAYLPYPVKMLKNHDLEPPFVDGEDGPEILHFLVEYGEKYEQNNNNAKTRCL